MNTSTVRRETAAQANSTPFDESSEKPARLGGVHKAAVLILSLDEEVASELLQFLDDQELERLTTEIARLGVVDQDTVASVLEEYQDLSQLHGMLREGGPDQAIRLVEKAFPPDRSRRLVELLEANRDRLPFAFLSGAQTESLLALLEGEQPQTAAVVLAHMTPSKAAEVLRRFPSAERGELIRRIAGVQATPPEVIEELEERLRKHLDTTTLTPSRAPRSGVQALADILRAAGEAGRDMLECLGGEAAGLRDEVQRRMFVFEDLVHLDDGLVGRVLKGTGQRQLALILKAGSPQLEEKILKNLSKRAAEAVREEQQALGSVRLAEVDAARESVVRTVLQLEQVPNLPHLTTRGRGE